VSLNLIDTLTRSDTELQAGGNRIWRNEELEMDLTLFADAWEAIVTMGPVPDPLLGKDIRSGPARSALHRRIADPDNEGSGWPAIIARTNRRAGNDHELMLESPVLARLA
jgi:hypothetical protein